MSTETVLVSEVIFATRQRLYDAWLDSKEHSAFTGQEAEIEPMIGGIHSSFAGYATGQNVALEPHRRIVQTWRTSEFPAGAADSHLEVTFEDTLGGTLVTVLHTGIPSGQSDQCREGWLKFYFAPMKAYFAKESTPEPAPDFDPGALAPAPVRKIARPAAKPKANAVAKKKANTKTKAKPNTAAKAKARKPAVKAKVKAKPKAAAKAKPKLRKQAVKAKTAKPTKKKAAKAPQPRGPARGRGPVRRRGR